MPEIYEMVDGGHEPPRQEENRYRRMYWDRVLDTNIPAHRSLKNGANRELRMINLATYYKDSRKSKVTDEDETDFVIRTQPGTRYDYEGKSEINMPSCLPKCTSYPGHWLPTYTGFPLFLTFTTFAQVAIFVYFYASEACHLTSINWYCSAQNSVALSGRKSDDIWNYDIWRLWTYQFAHAGVEHLLPNVIMQIIFGAFLEVVQGPLRVGCLYTLGVVFGGCFSLIVSPYMNLVGASAGVYALITAVLANTALNWSELEIWGRCARVFLSGGYLVLDILVYLYGDSGNVSYVAHTGGAIVGLLLGLVVLKNWQIKKHEVWCQFISFALFLIILILTAILLIVGDRTHTTFFN